MRHGAAIMWNSKQQRTVALFTAEAEYVALTEAGRDAIWAPARHLARGSRTLANSSFANSELALANSELVLWLATQAIR